MYFWDITTLSRELARKEISEKSGMYYFMASSLLILFTTYYSLWWGVTRDWLFYTEFLVLSLITIYGCLKSFEANGGNQGNLFVFRAICLSVPAGIRVALFSVLFGFILFLFGEKIFSPTSFANPQNAYLIISYVGFVGFNIYFWWLLVTSFKKILVYENNT